jgi:hypothetical protein
MLEFRSSGNYNLKMKKSFLGLISWAILILLSCSEQKEIPNITKPDPRILAIGNSITFHPPSVEVGWNGNWGMAASSAEKDYFSLLESMVLTKKPQVEMMRENVFPFERGFEAFDFSFYNHLKEFNPDILIIRFGENIEAERVSGNVLSNAIKDFVQFLADGREMKIIVTTTFWPNELVNQQLMHAAQINGWEIVMLNDLGSSDENMAIGLFDNGGVARHPGDLGMQRIANRIITVLQKLI